MNMQPLQYQMYAAMDRGDRKEQQDAVNSSFPELQEDLGVLCVLSDGMGGLSDGFRASETVVQTMVSVFHRSSAEDKPEQILLRACCFSQQAVREQQKGAAEAGATLAAVLIRNGRCSYLSAGDSRIYLFRGGALIQLSRDQNKAARIERQIALGRIPEEAMSDSERDALSSYIGMEHLQTVDRGSSSFEVIPGDRLLLVSDGVYKTLSEEEIGEIMCLPGEAATITMIRQVAAKNLPGQDNCSAAVTDCIGAAMPVWRGHGIVPEAGGAQWPGTRKEQNDAFLISDYHAEKGMLVVLADGIGLDRNAGQAAKTAVSAVLADYSGKEPAKDLRRQTMRMLGSAHAAVRTVNEKNRERGHPATGVSALCALIQNQRLCFSSVGNVRIFLIRGGKMIQLNRDHLLSIEAEERDILRGEAPAVNPEWAKRVTAFLGMEDLQKIDCPQTPVFLIPGDRIMIMSSGLYGALREEELCALACGAPPEQASKDIIDRVREKRGTSQSNVTVVLIRIGQSN